MNSSRASRWPVSGGVLKDLLPAVSFPEPPKILQTSEPPPKRPTGLFEELLHGRPDALYADALEHEDRYDPPTTQLLGELVTARRAPTDEERTLLDRATFEFATAKNTPPEPVKKALRKERRDEEEMEEEAPAVPLEALPPFWWR